VLATDVLTQAPGAWATRHTGDRPTPALRPTALSTLSRERVRPAPVPMRGNAISSRTGSHRSTRG